MTSSMTVPTLKNALARLLQTHVPLSLLVAPQLAALDHQGTIVSRFLPGTVLPCPYLEPGTLVHVLPNQVLDSSFLSGEAEHAIG